MIRGKERYVDEEIPHMKRENISIVPESVQALEEVIDGIPFTNIYTNFKVHPVQREISKIDVSEELKDKNELQYTKNMYKKQMLWTNLNINAVNQLLRTYHIDPQDIAIFDSIVKANLELDTDFYDVMKSILRG